MDLGVSFADFSLKQLGKSVSKRMHLSKHTHAEAAEGQIRSESLILTAGALERLRYRGHTAATKLSAATNEKMEAWRKLRLFVGLSEEVVLVDPLSCQPCGKPSCTPRGERLVVGVLPLLMLGMFVAIVFSMVDDVDSTVGASRVPRVGADIISTNGSIATNATTMPVISDAKAALVADAAKQGRDIAVRTSTRVMLVVTTVVFGLFLVLRRRVPLVYGHRNSDKLPLKPGLLSWLPQLLGTSDEDVLEHAGVDAFVFLRIPQLACRFCVLVFFPVGLPIMLVNFYANDAVVEVGARTSRLSTLTISNIANGGWMLWLHVIGAWYMSWVLLMLLKQETRIYIRARHRYFREIRPQDYSIFVQDLPPDVRTSDALMDLFRKFYPDSDLHSCCVLPDCRHLADLMANADALALRLEKAVQAEQRCVEHQILAVGSARR